MKRIFRMVFISMAGIVLLWGGIADAGMGRSAAAGDRGNDTYINFIVREVKVTPIRAHVGDPVRIEMIVENRGDYWNTPNNAEILANGKVVLKKWVDFGFESEGNRTWKISFLWDTKGVKPGEYRIRGQFFIFYDASPFDNFLDVAEPLTIVPAGAAFPGGKTAGGTGVGRDPRYKPAAGPGESGTVPEGSPGSY